MKKIANIILILTVLIAPAFIVVGQSSAVNLFGNTCGANQNLHDKSSTCQDVHDQDTNGGNPIIKIIKDAIDLVSKIVGIAAIIGVIVSGIRLIVSSGDSSAVATARTGLAYSLIGVGVTIFAQLLVIYVLKDVQ